MLWRRVNASDPRRSPCSGLACSGDARVRAGFTVDRAQEARYMDVALLRPEQHWVCPNCTETAVTHHTRPSTEFHHCRGLQRLWAPFVIEGTRCKVESHERDDYVGRDDVQYDAEHRPIMSITTERDDGQDCTVLAPCAVADAREYR